MCVPLAVAAAGAAAVTSAAGQIVSGQYANAQAKYESAVAKQNAQQSVDAYRDYRGPDGQAQNERTQFWRKVGQIKGQNIAAMAANGIDVGVGSAERLQEDTQTAANEDFSNLASNQMQKEKGYLIDASNYTSEAKAARMRGKQAVIGSYFGAASTILGGLSQAALLSKPTG